MDLTVHLVIRSSFGSRTARRSRLSCVESILVVPSDGARKMKRPGEEICKLIGWIKDYRIKMRVAEMFEKQEMALNFIVASLVTEMSRL